MIDWSVTLTIEVKDPFDDSGLLRNLDDDAVLSFESGVVVVATDTEAADVTSAIQNVRQDVEKAAVNAGVLLGATVGAEALEWERYAARVEVPNYPDLVSASEVGDILSVSRQRVHQLLSESRLPEPFMRLGSGPLWIRSAIEAFDRSWSRKPGRPARTGADAIAAREDMAVLQAELNGPGTALEMIRARTDHSIEEMSRTSRRVT